MGEAVKMPSVKLPKIDLPRPLRWDWIAIASLVVGVIFIAANLAIGLKKPVGEPFPSAWTGVFVFGQLAVACGGLMLLGKTAKEGTGWGNAASLLAMVVGISGVLLAAALWAAA
jgi:hypothetical protein